MKNYRYIYVAVLFIWGLVSCESHTYDEIGPDEIIVEGDVTYTANVKSIITSNCVSCHVAGGVASFRPLTTYEEVKSAVENDDLLDLIQRQNGESGAMPQTGRMPQATINVVLEWYADGLQE